MVRIGETVFKECRYVDRARSWCRGSVVRDGRFCGEGRGNEKSTCTYSFNFNIKYFNKSFFGKSLKLVEL